MKFLNILINIVLLVNILSPLVELKASIEDKDNFEDEPDILPIKAQDLFDITGTNVKYEGDYILLTPDQKNQVGSAFLKNTISMENDFTVNIDIDAGIDKGKPNTIADGIGLAFHKSPKSTRGKYGGGLGILGLKDGIGYEFDTYVGGWTIPDDQDPEFDHKKWNTPHRGFVSTDKHSKRLTALAPMKAFKSATVGNQKRYKGNVEFNWNSEKNILSVTYEPYGEEPEPTDTIHIPMTDTEKREQRSFNISAATGGTTSQHRIKINTIDFCNEFSGNIIVRYKDIQTGKKIRPDIKQTAIDGISYDTTRSKIEFKNYKFAKVEEGSDPQIGKIERGKSKIVTFLYKNDDEPISKEIKYVYKHDPTKEVFQSENILGYENEEYNTQGFKKQKDGYKFALANTSSPEIGKYSKTDNKPVIYEYTAIEPNENLGSVEIIREDKYNRTNIIEEPTIIKGYQNDTYNTDVYKELTGTNKDKYTLVGIKEGYSPEGVFEAKKEKQVIYQYELKESIPDDQKGTLVVKYLDQNAQIIPSLTETFKGYISQ